MRMLTRVCGIFTFVLLTTTFAQTSHAQVSLQDLQITNQEIFWGAECNETRGLLTYDHMHVLRRLLDIDAFYLKLNKMSLSDDVVHIAGVIGGLTCDREVVEKNGNQIKTYKWNFVSLSEDTDFSPFIQPSNGILFDDTFQIQIRDQLNFSIDIPAKDFLSKKQLEEYRKSNEIKHGKLSIVLACATSIRK